MPRSKAQLDNLKKGAATRFKSGVDAVNAAKKSHISREKNRTARKVFNAILETVPKLDDATTAELIGMTENSGEKLDVMALIGFAMAQKAMKGDAKAAQFVFRTAGQDVETEIQKERNRIEKDKLALEREKYEASKSLGNTDTLTENTLIEALQQSIAGTLLQSDVPENTAGDE